MSVSGNPSRAQKCLFGTTNNFIRRNSYNKQKVIRITELSSEDESDLGPMSPLGSSDENSSSCDSSPERQIVSSLTTLKKSYASGDATDKVIPQTPQRYFAREMQNDIVETPRKNDKPEQKLITPLSSDNKIISLPKLHRRKSFNPSEIRESFSPKKKENMLKRHAHETLSNNGSKLMKTDENCSVPKARAALFQEKKYDKKLESLTLSTKSFYSNSCETKRKPSPEFKYTTELTKQLSRRSFPTQNNRHRRSSNNHKLSGFNAGVSHAIRKPRFKPNTEIIKKEIPIENATNIFDSILKSTIVKKANISAISVQNTLTEIDPNKRFFKNKRVINSNNSALKTINGKKELEVQKDKATLDKLNCSTIENVYKKSNPTQISFDTTDLIVDEPELEISLEQNNVANILKTLEDDWANDDYDTMGPVSNQIMKTMTSPEKSTTLLKNITMSPASELSNMASSMNIEDVAMSTTPLNDSNDNRVVVGQKYYPIFNKGHSSNKVFEETGTRKSQYATKQNVSWQLSVKGGKEEKQYQIDAGQNHFGATQCPDCHVVYQIGDPEDEYAHLNYHNSINVLKFPGWKTERVIMKDNLTSSRIILVEWTDSKQYWNKVLRILAVVDRDLGLVDTKLSNYEEKKVYLYIRDKNVLGVLVAEHIKTAHRMIPELLELDCCTAESTPAKCGINIIWTVLNHRRQGIATKLMDTLRTQFYYGYVMSMDDIAFSIPTPSGKVFAEKYTKTRNFKVYN